MLRFLSVNAIVRWQLLRHLIAHDQAVENIVLVKT